MDLQKRGGKTMDKDEIKMVLDYCLKSPYCEGCIYYGERDCNDKLKLNALNLINEQEKEIERLKKENDCLLKACEEPFTFNTTQNKKYSLFNSVRKEFAERIKEKYGQSCSEYYPVFIEMTSDDIDKLLKEYE